MFAAFENGIISTIYVSMLSFDIQSIYFQCYLRSMLLFAGTNGPTIGVWKKIELKFDVAYGCPGVNEEIFIY